MSKTLSIDVDAPIKWPQRCARCDAKTNLTSANASIGSMTSVSPTFGGVAVGSTMATLSYPVCKEHAAGLGFAGLVTRRTAGFRFLRGFIYFMAALGVPMLLVVFLRVTHITAPSRYGEPWPFIGIFAAAVAAAAYLIHAKRTLPVRLVGQSKEAVTIRFVDDVFAASFAMHNRPHLCEVPWYKKFVI